MANLIALEWDVREARVVVGQTRGNSMMVQQAFAVPLSGEQAEGSPAAHEQIVEAIKAKGIGKAEALVAIGRSSIELRQLEMPPCPDDELPDMVRLQAMRQFTGINESWMLDYVPLQRLGESESIHVLAAAVSDQMMGPVNALCKSADLSLKRVVLRPFAAASLLPKSESAEACRLFVDMLAEEADLTVLVGDDVVFVRTVRMPASGDATVRANALLGEIRRTIPAARNQTGGREVGAIALCGDRAELGPLQELVETKLDLPCSFLDPFASVRTHGSMPHPENPGRYASILGAMDAYANQTSAGVDFLNPRKRPRKQSNARRYAFAGALAAICVGVIGFLGWFELNRLGGEAARLQAQFDQETPQVEKMRERTATVAAINEHLEDRNIVWLDELRDLCEKSPDSDLAMFGPVTMTPDPKGPGGKITAQVYLADEDVVDSMRRQLDEGERRRVLGGTISSDRQFAGFQYRATESYLVLPVAEKEDPAAAKKEELLERLEEPPGDAAPDASTRADDPVEQTSPEDPAPENAAPENAAPENAAPEENAGEESSEKEPSTTQPDEAKEATEPPQEAPAKESPDLTGNPTPDSAIVKREGEL